MGEASSVIKNANGLLAPGIFLSSIAKIGILPRSAAVNDDDIDKATVVVFDDEAIELLRQSQAEFIALVSSEIASAAVDNRGKQSKRSKRMNDDGEEESAAAVQYTTTRKDAEDCLDRLGFGTSVSARVKQNIHYWCHRDSSSVMPKNDDNVAHIEQHEGVAGELKTHDEDQQMLKTSRNRKRKKKDASLPQNDPVKMEQLLAEQERLLATSAAKAHANKKL